MLFTFIIRLFSFP